MFQFENAEYQSILETSLKRTSIHAKDCKKKLSDLQECLNDLAVKEVEFILALRKLGWTARCKILNGLSACFNGSIKVQTVLCRIQREKDFVKAVDGLLRSDERAAHVPGNSEGPGT